MAVDAGESSNPPLFVALHMIKHYSLSLIHFFLAVFSVILALTLFIRVLVSPSLALLTIAAIYSNVWVPQIIRSVRRGTTSGLRAEYLLGTTTCRAFFATCEFYKFLGF
jgi:hypothetical protein